MAYRASVPGLNNSLNEEDLEQSRNIFSFRYNGLPDDSRQPEIFEAHIRDLAALFVRNHAQGIFGIHLAHAHFAIPKNTILLGANHDIPRCRWEKVAKALLQAIDSYFLQMLELVLPHGAIMQIGWKFETQHGEPRVYQANESHGQTRIGHEICNKGEAHPKLETFQHLKYALAEAGIL
ncbi:hypothetical protein B0T26DRAFT_744198 [Lasiosphaeria miniovina]|uniref:Uncharacterized protein n=1 Tax=Lasiosphaeria miniovina TaxID=1954250 RepID=A0AA39ZT05_9PEZI|nr:uncharacterized protein B0T26DRAFT_744198 [Lasiosphaeria miniovina]KAK0703090.1 hypothetical protein B0T26DRAFT_744198 [Lasiosphaeria miniovina]